MNQILPNQYQITICALCDKAGSLTPETLLHALMECPENQELPALLLMELRATIPGITFNQVLTLDIEVEPEMELPLLWLVGSFLLSLWTQRILGRVSLAKTRAELEARCHILREGKVPAVVNASITSAALIESIFNRHRQRL